MIATSVDPNNFAQIIPDPRFSVDAPNTNPLMAASSLDVTRTESGLALSAAERTEGDEPRSVERALRDMIMRCRRDLENHPGSVQMMLNLALALINAGDPAAGEEILKHILEVEPDNYAALTSQALLFFNRGEFEKATEAYLRVHSAYPNDPSPLINLASIALRNEDFVNAANYLEEAVTLDGCSVMARYLLAMVLIRLGKQNQSIGMLRAALRDSGPSAELNQGLAIAYLLSGDPKRAERAFSVALTINKHMLSATHGLALLRIQQHRWDEVVETLTDHLRQIPNDEQGRELLARAYVELSQFSRARSHLLMLIPTRVETPRDRSRAACISNNIGFCFAKEGKAKEAEFWLTRSLDLEGKRIAAPYTNLARLLYSQRRFPEALDLLVRLDDLHLTSSDSSLLKSNVLVNLQRNEEAIEILQGLVNTQSAPSAAYAELGWLLADWNEQYDAALAVLRQGFERDPSNIILLNNLAYVHLMRGEPDFARAVLDQIKDDRVNPIVLTATRGLLLLWEGDFAGGEELYKRAETLAVQSGQKDMAISARHKRHLEMAHAYLRSGQTENAIKQIKMGANTTGGERFYRYLDQLVELGQRLQLPSST